eukprot:740678-Hanusia_phi.AAC.2
MTTHPPPTSAPNFFRCGIAPVTSAHCPRPRSSTSCPMITESLNEPRIALRAVTPRPGGSPVTARLGPALRRRNKNTCERTETVHGSSHLGPCRSGAAGGGPGRVVQESRVMVGASFADSVFS